jgi:hypothetical protein
MNLTPSWLQRSLPVSAVASGGEFVAHGRDMVMTSVVQPRASLKPNATAARPINVRIPVDSIWSASDRSAAAPLGRAWREGMRARRNPDCGPFRQRERDIVDAVIIQKLSIQQLRHMAANRWLADARVVIDMYDQATSRFENAMIRRLCGNIFANTAAVLYSLRAPTISVKPHDHGHRTTCEESEQRVLRVDRF